MSAPVSPLIGIVKDSLSRIKNRGDIPNETLEYFLQTKTWKILSVTYDPQTIV